MVELMLLAGLLFPPALEPVTLRYVRTTKDGVVPECILTIRTMDKHKEWLSVTDRGKEKMTLRVEWREEALIAAALTHETADGTKTAALKRMGDTATLTKGAASEKLEAVPAHAVVTTAPDWTDIFLMVLRYDAAKGGKQEFPGVWIHPEKATLRPIFSAERTGAATITWNGKPMPLDRYRIRLRSGEYAVWADATRRVVKLQAVNQSAPAVLLEGYEEATRPLK